MTQVDKALLNRTVTAIVDEVIAERVILFGPHACGDAEIDSDVDLVVIEAEPFGPARDRRAEAVWLWRTLAGIVVAVRFEGLLDYAPFAVQFRYVEANNGSEPFDRGVAVKQVETLLDEDRRRLEEAERL